MNDGDLLRLALLLEDERACGDAAGLPVPVRRAVLAAFDRGVAGDLSAPLLSISEPGLTTSGQVSDARDTVASGPIASGPVASGPVASGPFGGWRAVAAVLFVGFAVAIIAMEGPIRDRLLGDVAPSAEAGIRFDSLTRYSGRQMASSSDANGAFARVGDVFAPADDETITLAFGGGGEATGSGRADVGRGGVRGSHLIVRGGDTLRIDSRDQLAPALITALEENLSASGLHMDLGALLRLASGEALLKAAVDRPVLLAVGTRGLLVLLQGACHVAVDPGADAGEDGPAIALEAGGRARFYRADGRGGAQAFDLSGPSRVLLSQSGPVAHGAPAASLFRDLAVFGGALRDANGLREYRIRGALWRRLDGQAERRGERFRVAVDAGADEAHPPVRLAWRPVASLASARGLRISLRAPAGMQVTVRSEKSEADGGFAVVAHLDEDTREQEPGLLSPEIELPTDWLDVVGSGELVIELSARPGVSEAGHTALSWAWFDGVAFVLAERDTHDDSSADGAGRGR